MSLETSIREAILGSTAIANIVDDRVVPIMLAPDDVIDSIVYRIVNRTSEQCMDGVPGDRAGTCTLQLAARSDSFDTRGELTEAIIERLDTLDGDFDTHSLTFLLTDSSDNTPPPLAGDEFPDEYGDALDFTVLFETLTS